MIRDVFFMNKHILLQAMCDNTLASVSSTRVVSFLMSISMLVTVICLSTAVEDRVIPLMAVVPFNSLGAAAVSSVASTSGASLASEKPHQCFVIILYVLRFA